MTRTYYSPRGGLPDPRTRAHDRARFTTAYAVIPRGVMSDIVSSFVPGWTGSRVWILARPLSGFAETFAQYIVELMPGGRGDKPEPDPEAQAVLFVLRGTVDLIIDEETTYNLVPGSFAYIPPGLKWQLLNTHTDRTNLMWFRKRYEPVPGLEPPDLVIAHDDDVEPEPIRGTDNAWSTTRFVDPGDLRHDMHVNVVTFYPGATIPFAETHVMEHGIYILQGRGVYYLNEQWVEVQEGDFLWLRAFCPQACCATGTEPFRYLLYKDVNRHPKLSL
ncbi:bifunctional allantoicase/(S)-ureidoglycine aminohydrolase [Aestuariibius insulae]|uniref:bifunctional allantoicase/(S)-ureidoglycine aminohydrolase n=1 Tax=Aestuariibius insulae TaxID=2058287 RepID=UPI00345E1325